MTKPFTASPSSKRTVVSARPQAPMGSCFGTVGSAKDVTGSVELNGKTAIVVGDWGSHHATDDDR